MITSSFYSTEVTNINYTCIFLKTLNYAWILILVKKCRIDFQEKCRSSICILSETINFTRISFVFTIFSYIWKIIYSGDSVLDQYKLAFASNRLKKRRVRNSPDSITGTEKQQSWYASLIFSSYQLCWDKGSSPFLKQCQRNCNKQKKYYYNPNMNSNQEKLTLSRVIRLKG